MMHRIRSASFTVALLAAAGLAGTAAAPDGMRLATVGLSGPPELGAPGEGHRLPGYVLRLRVRPEELQ